MRGNACGCSHRILELRSIDLSHRRLHISIVRVRICIRGRGILVRSRRRGVVVGGVVGTVLRLVISTRCRSKVGGRVRANDVNEGNVDDHREEAEDQVSESSALVGQATNLGDFVEALTTTDTHTKNKHAHRDVSTQ